MKFSCEKETLLNLLNIASRAVTGKSSMPPTSRKAMPILRSPSSATAKPCASGRIISPPGRA